MRLQLTQASLIRINKISKYVNDSDSDNFMIQLKQ